MGLKNDAVREKDYSHCVLEMFPTQADFRAHFVIGKVHGESLGRVSEYAVVHDVDDSGSMAVVRGKVYELLCHKWFSVHMQRTLHFRSLCSATLHWTYNWPTSKTFGALGALIWDGHSKCDGLQMTLNAYHGH
ncbi:hypothetical protein GN244_ATG13221 [Phytophthora infestans]|uniref:Uncharacterized protein n=1 Tax=Phytophthora infestans TaxID=4787 RepID=A0A833SXV8_PHYIN|nr:hypothetical protein GN244_ATG13221 [Phytophthora infestans]